MFNLTTFSYINSTSSVKNMLILFIFSNSQFSDVTTHNLERKSDICLKISQNTFFWNMQTKNSKCVKWQIL